MDQKTPSGARANDAPPAAWVERSQRSLAMAGWVLDTNSPGGPDLGLAKLLLAHALVAAAGAGMDDATPLSPAQAIDVLEQSLTLADIDGGVVRGRRALSHLVVEDAPSRDELVEAELLLREVLRGPRRRRAARRTARWTRSAFLLVFAVTLGAVFLPRFWPKGPWAHYKWMASSAAYGFQTSGELGARGPADLTFHTDYEQNPWVLIDLLKVRWVHRVEITNRTDCCEERCLPLVVEIAGADGKFTEVAVQPKRFDAWNFEFYRRPVRYVRLHVEGLTYFHLQEVKVL